MSRLETLILGGFTRTGNCAFRRNSYQREGINQDILDAVILNFCVEYIACGECKATWYKDMFNE